LTEIPAEIPHCLPKDLLEGLDNSEDHGDRQEDDGQQTHQPFGFRDNFKGEASDAGDEGDDEHHTDDEDVPVEEDDGHEGEESDEEEELDGRLEDAGKGAAAIVQALAAPFLFIGDCLCPRVREGQQLSIFIVVAIVRRGPLRPTDVAELVSAPARNMVAALVLLHHHLASLALPVVQVVLEEAHLLPVTVSHVHAQKTLAAELLAAAVASHRGLARGADDPLAVLLRAEFDAGVFGDQVELVNFLVALLNVRGQIFEKISGHIEYGGAALAGAVDLLEVFDLVDDIVM
jgi:hypothetical protein